MGYSDAPDGQQCFQKIWEVSKYAGFMGLVVSTLDTWMVTKPQGYVPTIATYLKSFLPMTAAGATFAAVTCTACNLRGKDDKINYVLGGASSGAIFGVAARSFKVGVPVAFFLSIAAALYKDSKDYGWDIVPKGNHKYGSFDHMHNDYTLLQEKK